MKKLILTLIIFIFQTSAFADEMVPIAGFTPISSQNQPDSELFKAKENAIIWIKKAYPELNEKGKIISEIAIDRLSKSTIRRPIDLANYDANFNCNKEQNRMSQVFPINPLEIYICPNLYSEIVNKVKNLFSMLTQNLIHESWHLFEAANNIKANECGATDFEVAIVESNNAGCIFYKSYANSCGIKYSLCR